MKVTGMTEIKSETSPLQWKLLTKKRASSTQGLPPGKEHLAWVSNTVTLIYGRRDAVLVDTFLTVEHAKELVDWVIASGKNLVTIYITHAHGDHYFGLMLLRDHFPNAKAIATAKVVKAMRDQIAPQFVKSFWEVRLPGQIPKALVAANVLEGSEFELEGKKLVVEEVGHTDTADTTSLYIPSIDLVVAGDAVYNGVHPYLVESNKQTRLEWIAALDKIEALNPRAVIAGHKVPENDDDPKNIEETRRYIRDFIRLNDSTQTARGLYDRMLELYPNRVNPGSLWGSANAAKAS
jgi:glyoxylase-like metal-dependent hydrolase (beta-lactamase superfamily II)